MACSFPYSIENPRFTALKGSERYIPVPCGKCPSCVKRRTDSWIFRLLAQQKISESAAFVTLTYDTRYVPISRRGFMTLEKKHFQDFMKRFRTYHSAEPKISYYAVGEYGSTTLRPHYHAIIFNCDVNNVDPAWQMGEIHVGDVKGDSVAYTTKYINKGKIIPVHANDDRVPEFSLMSKKLGLNYINEDTLKWHHADLTRNYILLEGGHKIALPRYFRERIYNEEQREQQNKLIAETSKKAEAKKEREFAERTGNPDDYVRAKFEAKKAELINFRKQNNDKRNKI